jgi:CO dehydrogenase nickel-insertion accessory protein CooC1
MKLSVCGKGGSGKSTLVSLLSAAVQAKGLKTLVIDSDESNSGLFRMLGFRKPPVPLMSLVAVKKGLNKIDSDRLGSKLKKELKNRDIETIGVISYDRGIFTAGLTGNSVRHVQSIRKAEKILDRLLSKMKNKDRE